MTRRVGKGKIETGFRYELPIDQTKMLTISVYPGRIQTRVDMMLKGEEEESIEKSYEKKHLNFNLFLPKGLAFKLARSRLNTQSQKVANIDLVK